VPRASFIRVICIQLKPERIIEKLWFCPSSVIMWPESTDGFGLNTVWHIHTKMVWKID
jgi:hypothetical protein